ncbi:hypothetical protein [Anabaena sp. UHCC 0451]|uniref:hypothetical protein n=1 Tax=Anabaena sp. UHCC 0451 TaxID=2055235 RepID=UPI002B2088C7|nr:hypothetical protein [Anabaena sp. UHCC 0451]MEA5579384.1 hypothetical protein [Anabaena sp. UHCC 0451]
MRSLFPLLLISDRYQRISLGNYKCCCTEATTSGIPESDRSPFPFSLNKRSPFPFSLNKRSLP